MADFEKAVKIVLDHEGGFVNDPVDPGGATMRGITFALFKQYATVLGLQKTVDALQNLTEDQAKFIYRERFWEIIQGDDIKSQQVANILFNAYVNMGIHAIRIMQRAVGTDADGVFGPQTLYAINTAAPAIAFAQFKEGWQKYYDKLVEKKPPLSRFIKGWTNRVNSFKYEIPLT